MVVLDLSRPMISLGRLTFISKRKERNQKKLTRGLLKTKVSLKIPEINLSIEDHTLSDMND